MLLCFDMDGTVIDSMSALKAEALRVISRYHTNLSLEEILTGYNMTVGKPFAEQLNQMFPGDSSNKLAASRYEYRHRELCSTFVLSPGIHEAMEIAKSKDHKLALVTSTHKDFLRELQVIRKLPFDSIDAFYDGNPKTAQLTKVRRRFLSGTQILFGDSPSDEQCAAIVRAEFRLVTVDNVAETLLGVING